MLLKLTDWPSGAPNKLTPAKMTALLNVEFGGMNEILYNIYAITKILPIWNSPTASITGQSDPLANSWDRLAAACQHPDSQSSGAAMYEL